MNDFMKRNILPLGTLGVGLVGMILRLVLNGTADDKGFVTRDHWSLVVLLVLTALFLAALGYGAQALRQANKYSFNFPASTVAAVGTLIGAVGIAVTAVIGLFSAGEALDVVSALMGLAAAAALVPVAHARQKGLRPSVVLHSIVCAYLMLGIISRYRHWSSDPQLTDYAFELLALICAMLAVYHRATFAADYGRRESHTFFTMAAVYFCCLSLAGSDGALLYATLGVWLLPDHCVLTPMPRAFRRNRS